MNTSAWAILALGRRCDGIEQACKNNTENIEVIDFRLHQNNTAHIPCSVILFMFYP